ncbi:MAG: hypothetical protein ABSF69_16595 [Polyangiaceae bacterium]|jgi:hypothetical protein
MPPSLSKRPFVQHALGAALLAGAALAAGCAKGDSTTTPGGTFGPPGSTGSTSQTSGNPPAIGTSGGSGGVGLMGTSGGCAATGSCTDFAQACTLANDAGSCSASQFPLIADETWPSGSTPSGIFGTPASTAQAGGSGGPCLYEPAPGALYPNNWLRPRFIWTAPAGQTLFELRFHSKSESSDLLVYTGATKWTMPKSLWTSLASNVQGEAITVTIRGAGTNGSPSAGTGTNFIVAPAPAQGAMVFWSTASFVTNAATTNLQGFQVGDESTEVVLTPNQVTQTVWAQPPIGGNFPSPPVPEAVGCIGCHTATPDGNFVGFTAQWPWPNALASVSADAGVVGQVPPWLTAGAIANLSPNTNDANYAGGYNVSATNNVDNVMLGIETFSKGHYNCTAPPGDCIEIASLGASLDDPENAAGVLEGTQPSGVLSQLVWINLLWDGDADGGRPSAAPGAPNNGGWGILARTGDTNSAGAPSWSHDGMNVAYTSSAQGTMDGRLDMPMAGTTASVMVVPYNANATPGGAGGTPRNPLATSSTMSYYLPSFSPDDDFLAFDGVAAGETMYDEPHAEIFVASATGTGATPTRLAANDPAECLTGVTSPTPGVQNTWPKWAPAQAGGVAPSSDGKTYYWLTFSSIRINDPNSPASVGSSQMTGGGLTGKVQLYIAGVAVDTSANNAITTYPAVYLWNQDPTVNNLIPAWDNFAIPVATGVGMPPR